MNSLHMDLAGFRQIGHLIFGAVEDAKAVLKVASARCGAAILTIRKDDLSSAQTQELLRLHLAGMRATSPAGQVFALNLSQLQTPDVTVWSAWIENDIASVGALKALGEGVGEVKSMRTHPNHLRRGAAKAILLHIVAEARVSGLSRLSRARP